MVVVETLDVARGMSQDDSAPLVAHLERGREVEVHLGVTHHGSVQEKRLLVSRLAVLHVYLAGHGLHAIDDGGGSFGYLDALEPLTRDICQPERGSEPPHHRAVLVKHLGIHARKAQKTDLPCSCDRVRIPYSHACRILEAFRKVAACHLVQPGG